MKHNWPITLLMIGLFLLAQIIGLSIVSAYIDPVKTAETGETEWKPLPTIGGKGLERPEVEPKVSVFYILIALIIGTILILLIMRWQKVIIWKLWFWIAVLLCLHIAFSAFISSTAAFVLAFALATLKIFRPTIVIHNLTELFIYGGLAVIFVPILNVSTAIILLILISIYDMYAVWKSKHMARLAEFQAKSGVFAGLLLPYSPTKFVLTKKQAKKEKKGRISSAILGGGDIGFPLLFAGVLMKAFGIQALVISICAALALFGLLLYSKKKRFYPAMPFITAGCLIGYFLLLL